MSGYTLIEIVIVLMMIGIATSSFLFIQKSTFSLTNRTNRTIDAGHLIEKSIEKVRLEIGKSPATRFPFVLDSINNTTISDNGVQLRWTVQNAALAGTSLPNVRYVILKTTWDTRDSLVVDTYIAKDF